MAEMKLPLDDIVGDCFPVLQSIHYCERNKSAEEYVKQDADTPNVSGKVMSHPFDQDLG